MTQGINKDFHRPPKLEILVIIATLVVVAGHFIGSIWLYHATDWFDNLLHLAGGTWLTLAAVFFFRSAVSLPKTFLAVLGAILLWEIFEFGLNLYAKYAYGFTTPVGGNSLDTSLDIIFGILGALIVLIYLKNKKRG